MRNADQENPEPWRKPHERQQRRPFDKHQEDDRLDPDSKSPQLEQEQLRPDQPLRIQQWINGRPGPTGSGVFLSAQADRGPGFGEHRRADFGRAPGTGGEKAVELGRVAAKRVEPLADRRDQGDEDVG